MKTTPKLQNFILQLAQKHGVDLFQEGAQFSLAMPSRPDRWLIANLDGTRISVTHCWVEEAETLSSDLDMVFALHPEGWEPIELLHTNDVWEAYVQAAKAAGIPVYDEQGETYFAHFTEYWAHQLQQQGWLTQAGKVEEAEAEWKDKSGGRLAGCQSTHPGPCSGELWQCAACGKTVCFAEGSDNHPELCDDCWCKRYAAQGEVDDVPF